MSATMAFRAAFEQAAVADAPNVFQPVMLEGNREISPNAMFDLLHLLQDVTTAARKKWDQELRKNIPGMSVTRASVIRGLARSGVMTQVQLARLVGLSQMSLTRLLDDLEGKGWVRREANAIDRRMHCVLLTGKGREVMSAIDSRSREFIGRDFGHLDEGYAAVLTSALAKLR